ncbi:MAG: PilZ domain-containing protein [Candidatus Omnitrophota bacterium]
MLLVYLLLLVILLTILLLLKKEERLSYKNISRGSASKYWSLKERRRFIRFKDDINIRYNVLPKKSNTSPSKSIDISQGGLCLLTYEKLRERSSLQLELDVPGQAKPLIVKGQVMWTRTLQSHDKEGRRLFYAGIKFYKVNPKNKQVLLVHLSTLSPEEKVQE